MNITRSLAWSHLAILMALSVASGWNTACALPQAVRDEHNEFEILTRGPVHEAFAETVTFDPQPGVIVNKSPPAAIEELPPEHRPEGTNVDWIPGYWAWDDERSDFLWVSGVWRALPPGRQWIPGYWISSAQGAQWTSGYWANASSSEIEYLPEPPASVEAGPNVEAPNADNIWLPGCWSWQQNRYVWRPGYWATGNDDWDWIPAHYVWTRRGYVFVDSYYDYSIARRGVLFAPVYFHSQVYSQRGYTYSPSTVINSTVFSNHLFLRPGYGHYYFGDYYDSGYVSRGYLPSFSFYIENHGYDPFYAQQYWRNRSVPQWQTNYEANFRNRREHQETRPPRTWSEHRARNFSAGDSATLNLPVAESFDEMARNEQQAIRFQKLDQTQREQLTQRDKAIRQYRELREKLENEGAGKSSVDRQFPIGKAQLPASPIAAPPTIHDKNHLPPQMHTGTAPDLNVKPNQRKVRGNNGSRDRDLLNPQIPGNPKSPKNPKSKGGNTRPQGKM